MIGKFVSLLLLQMIIVKDYLFCMAAKDCGMAMDGDFVVYTFRNENAEFIKNCLDVKNGKIKSIFIQNCTVPNADNILSGNIFMNPSSIYH